MAAKPTYKLEDLKEAIPVAGLEDIKDISITLRNEQELYYQHEYMQIITLLTKRLIEVINNIKV